MESKKYNYIIICLISILSIITLLFSHCSFLPLIDSPSRYKYIRSEDYAFSKSDSLLARLCIKPEDIFLTDTGIRDYAVEIDINIKNKSSKTVFFKSLTAYLILNNSTVRGDVTDTLPPLEIKSYSNKTIKKVIRFDTFMDIKQYNNHAVLIDLGERKRFNPVIFWFGK